MRVPSSTWKPHDNNEAFLIVSINQCGCSFNIRNSVAQEIALCARNAPEDICHLLLLVWTDQNVSFRNWTVLAKYAIRLRSEVVVVMKLFYVFVDRTNYRIFDAIEYQTFSLFSVKNRWWNVQKSQNKGFSNTRMRKMSTIAEENISKHTSPTSILAVSYYKLSSYLVAFVISPGWHCIREIWYSTHTFRARTARGGRVVFNIFIFFVVYDS